MRQEKDGKTLYHVQAITGWHDDAYDMFVWADSESTIRKNLKKLYQDDFCDDMDKKELNDLIQASNIYTVYAEEI